MSERESLRADRGSKWRAIFDALRDYRLSNMTFEGTDEPFCLVDLVSTIGGDISTGEDELIALADEISLAVDALSTEPMAQEGGEWVSPSAAFQDAEERICDCGAAASGMGHAGMTRIGPRGPLWAQILALLIVLGIVWLGMNWRGLW